MLSVATLGASLSHDLNTALANVVANLDFLAENLGRLVSESVPNSAVDAAPDDRQQLRKALEGALCDAHVGTDRIASIVSMLRLLESRESFVREAVDMRAVVESSIRLAMNEIRHRARLDRDIHPVPTIRADRRALEQALGCLLGEVAQRLPQDRLEENSIAVRLGPDAAGRVCVQIEAVSSSELAGSALLESDGSPTLGLVIARSLVEEVGGTISVQLAADGRLVFTIVMLAAGEEESPVAAPESALVAGSGELPRLLSARARILVVDDEEPVGRAIRRLLEADHDVTVATDGEEALEILGSRPDFDLVLCDLMMPRISGQELWVRVAATSPETAERFVFMTGGAFSEEARHFRRTCPNRVSDKPFRAEALRALVEEWLERRLEENA